MGGRGQTARRDFWPGNFCWPIRKREAWKKRKMEQKRRKIEKGKVENWKWKEEKLQNEERTFSFSFFLFFFLSFFFFLFFFLFFFFFAFIFENHWNLFWIYQNRNFLPGKSISRRGKNQEKWFCPLWKVFLLHPWSQIREVNNRLTGWAN